MLETRIMTGKVTPALSGPAVGEAEARPEHVARSRQTSSGSTLPTEASVGLVNWRWSSANGICSEHSAAPTFPDVSNM